MLCECCDRRGTRLNVYSKGATLLTCARCFHAILDIELHAIKAHRWSVRCKVRRHAKANTAA